MYQVPDQTGRVTVITGANSGLGKETTRRLVEAGGAVIMGVRDLAKGEAARQEILAQHPEADLTLALVDMADLSSIARFADAVLADGARIDTLINNAGLMAAPTRMTTVDGFELHMGTNFFGAFALTMRLLPRLLESPAPRVVMLSSNLARQGRIVLDDLQRERRRYSRFGAYGDSKLADHMMGLHLAKVAAERNWPLISAIAHPGYTNTNLQTAGASIGSSKVRSSTGFSQKIMPTQGVEEGAVAVLVAATDPKVNGGDYYGPTGRMNMIGPVALTEPAKQALDEDTAAKLWVEAERLTDTSLPS
ncbi:oxidoreductase [Demequina zhanjiangensis]|uniref:Oxidoreductase n=1 Tax=Demequina zhanjiangensis TaxID=3051659 RepID=A0ABT8FYF3_9MICO|nr:oxidoreductase [Demequina sp. SYSU T00b26]MDN4471928.1 oxidoreductase [Demequina sp. SYSU T00b26]